jgi:hypothetical protein
MKDMSRNEITFKIWARELNLGLKEILGPFSRTKGGEPPLGYMLVQVKSGQVKLTVTDFRNSFSSQCYTFFQEDEASFLVRIAPLKTIGRTAKPNTEITFHFNRDLHYLSVNSNGVKTELPTLEIEKWPLPIIELEQLTFNNKEKSQNDVPQVKNTLALDLGELGWEPSLSEVVGMLRKKGNDAGLNQEQMQLMDKNLREIIKLIRSGPPAEQLSLL